MDSVPLAGVTGSIDYGLLMIDYLVEIAAGEDKNARRCRGGPYERQR
jgi:hypothetical protein